MKYSKNNPLLSVRDVKSHDGFETIGIFNPGVTEIDKKILLLARVAKRPSIENTKIKIPYVRDGKIHIRELDANDNAYDFSDARTIGVKGGGKLLTSFSHFTTAISSDGTSFTLNGVDVYPSGEYEEFGIEDPRITKIDKSFYITYSAVSAFGVCTALMKTDDFLSFERLGIILPPDNKDATIFPDKINGKYYMLHRPSCSEFSRPEIWIAESQNLLDWGNHRRVCGVREAQWDSSRIGSSSVPIRTSEGYLVLYHGADEKNRYCMGALMLDPIKPWLVTKRSVSPFMQPINDYEKNGFFGGVVFGCGLIERNGNLQIYYGASDDKICRADIETQELIDSLKTER